MKYIEWLCWCIVAVFAVTDVYWILLDLFELWGWQEPDAAGWATWAQAVGSIAAILASVYVVNLQHRREQINNKLQVLRKEANLVTIAFMYASEFAILLKSINQQIGTDTVVRTSVLVTSHDRVIQCRARLETLPVWEMGIGEAGLVSALKTLADCTASALNVQDKGRELQPNNFPLALGPYEASARQITDVLKVQHDGMKRFLYLGTLDDLPQTW